jgi:hypothetical protein
MSTQIPVQSVELLYAEGRIGFTEQFMKTYEDLDQSDIALRKMASDAPDCGSYNKVGYKVTFADGETYEGRICLKRHDEFHSHIISRSMGSFVGFHAGRHCPDHMTRKSYQQFLDRLGEETLKEYADFQDQYSF